MSTKLDMTGWTDKDSKFEEIRQLYEELPYCEAYARHTDLRCDRPEGFRGAIGRADEWEMHGDLQLDFLLREGLTPSTKLLDIGCGAGRLARRAVPYLDPGCYAGVDLSPRVLGYARQVAVEEGWVARVPLLLQGDGTLGAVREARFEPEMAWAHSVLTHLPPESARKLLEDVVSFGIRVFAFTYKRAAETRRSGLKQFQYPPEWFLSEAESLGYRAKDLGIRWPAGQQTIRMWQP